MILIRDNITCALNMNAYGRGSHQDSGSLKYFDLRKCTPPKKLLFPFYDVTGGEGKNDISQAQIEQKQRGSLWRMINN